MNKKVIFITAAAGAMGSSQAQIFSKHGYKICLLYTSDAADE